ncbi:MAG: glycosyltransferase family 87 protein [Saprospiraceae bacterium]
MSRPLTALLIVYVLLTSYLTALDGGDFDVYLEAARKLSIGENIYAPPFIRDLQYFYSVFFALILIPFSKQVFFTEFLWSVGSYMLLYRTYVLVRGYLDFSDFSIKKQRQWTILTVVMALQFILYNVAMIQVTFFLLWAVFETLHLQEKNKYVLAGGLLGLAINIKIMPILMLPYLVYRGHWKTLIVCLATVVLLLFSPALFLGGALNAQLHAAWWSIINPGNSEHVFETGIGLHSIGTYSRLPCSN